jgi:hypothetical protein
MGASADCGFRRYRLNHALPCTEGSGVQHACSFSDGCCRISRWVKETPSVSLCVRETLYAPRYLQPGALIDNLLRLGWHGDQASMPRLPLRSTIAQCASRCRILPKSSSTASCALRHRRAAELNLRSQIGLRYLAAIPITWMHQPGEPLFVGDSLQKRSELPPFVF